MPEITSQPTDQLRYAGFWPRLGALLLDMLVMLPLSALALWGSEYDRLFSLYELVPSALFGLFYSVYLVRRFGGTPGKLLVGVRIRKVDGEAVGYREAFLRFLPEFVLGVSLSIAMLVSVLRMTDAEYHALSFADRSRRMGELAPAWYWPLQIVQAIWVWGELLVLLSNRKRRALHDFIAGTVVVHVSPRQPPESTIATPGN